MERLHALAVALGNHEVEDRFFAGPRRSEKKKVRLMTRLTRGRKVDPGGRTKRRWQPQEEGKIRIVGIAPQMPLLLVKNRLDHLHVASHIYQSIANKINSTESIECRGICI